MHFVEFLGPPGVGKSSILRDVVKHLQNENKDKYLTFGEAFLRVSKFEIDKVYRYILKALPKKMDFKFCEKLINRSIMQFEAQNRFIAQWGKSLNAFLGSDEYILMQQNERASVISSFLSVGSLYECLNRRLPRETAVFFDEGFIQKSFMFISPNNRIYSDSTFLFSYLDNIPIPDLTISVNADLRSCYERMMARPAGLTERLKTSDENSIIDFLKKTETHINTVVNWLDENRNINILSVNNDNDINEVVLDLGKEIKSIFHSH